MVLTLKTSLYKVAGVDLPFFFFKCDMHSGLHFNKHLRLLVICNVDNFCKPFSFLIL